MTETTLTSSQKEFLAQCEEDLKHRFTENDEEFMKVFKAEPSKPPIVDPWLCSQNTRRRNEKRFNRRYNAYERHGGYRGDYSGRRDLSDSGSSNSYQRPRYN